jgi:hypothetical protein
MNLPAQRPPPLKGASFSSQVFEVTHSDGVSDLAGEPPEPTQGAAGALKAKFDHRLSFTAQIHQVPPPCVLQRCGCARMGTCWVRC